MLTEHRRRFIYGQTLWMLLCLFVLSLLGTYSNEIFFALVFIGFLVLVELTAPTAVTPRWRRRLRWFIVVGTLVFGYIIVHNILEMLPAGVF
ncbi:MULTISPECIES: hypothetical protein [unclassified Haladaptatus]|uniref:hypothetical protein n=1 Tax=unclassified Haladaptatus TaxID=2622732 RepID=UPI00209C0BB1|nr:MULTISPECIES: hypothetical protein [unclassified Haladaptatus]MCO8245568.1 hypothetical protein [Haladaptatus sp. AB643]MCO8255396.1 hypothetical protein [Haladaptatus sp. AB618]